MIDLVRKGLSLRFTNQAAALVCGSSADVRPMSLLFTAWGQRRGPPPPPAGGGGGGGVGAPPRFRPGVGCLGVVGAPRLLGFCY